MPLRLEFSDQSFTLSNEVLQDIWQASEETNNSGREQGFDFCVDLVDLGPNEAGTRLVMRDRARLKSGKKCEGEICYIRITDCRDPDDPHRRWGDFHTHPTRNPGPSAGDLLSMLARGRNGEPALGCRAGRKRVISQDADGEMTSWEAPDLECEYVPEAPRGDLLTQMNDLYSREVVPLYDEWAEKGEQPSLHHPGYRAYDLIKRAIDAYAETVRVPATRLSGAMEASDDKRIVPRERAEPAEVADPQDRREHEASVERRLREFLTPSSDQECVSIETRNHDRFSTLESWQDMMNENLCPMVSFIRASAADDRQEVADLVGDARATGVCNSAMAAARSTEELAAELMAEAGCQA